MTPYIVQFPEKNFSSRDIAELSGDKLLVRSIWYTIQGEGPYAGYPAVFIRLAGCNRGAKSDACQFCDTDFLVEKSTKQSIESILYGVGTFQKNTHSKSLVVITGGEPVMHPNLNALVAALIDAGYLVQIESNGDFVRNDTAPGAVIVVSPKLSSHAGKYSKPHAEMLQRADYLKILVDSDVRSPYNMLPTYLVDFAVRKGSHSVFISPINGYARPVNPGEIASMWGDMYDREVCARNHAYAAQVAQDYAFRLSLQMHAYVAVL